jgi:transposase
MARALSDDLRLRVLKASSAGMSARLTAARFGVGISTTIRWIARAKDGEATSRPQGWQRSSSLDAHEAFVVEMIDDRKDVTLDEMVECLSLERQVGISPECAWCLDR